jgi:Protein of unknown function (DUF3352)
MTACRIAPQFVVIIFCSWSVAAVADTRNAIELLPPGMIAFAEILKPYDVLSAVYDHKLARRLESLEQVRAAMQKKQYLEFKAVVAIIESQMGLPWRRIVEQATGGGLYVATDASPTGAIILARATDNTIHANLLATLTKLASQDAKGKGKPDPVKIQDYRGIKVYTVEKTRFAVVEDWLVITNNDKLGKQIVDRIRDKPETSLASDPQFAKAHRSMGASTIAWVYVNAAALRDAGVGKDLLSGNAQNPLAELFLGGILNALHHTPYVTLALESGDRHVRLSISAPYDREWAKDSREYYFGPEGKGAAPPQIFVDDTIVSVSSYRDVAAMWRGAGDLFNEQMNEELAKADSGLTTLFGGKDFGEDILGAFRPETQVVVARQHFAKGQPVPDIQLPAFAIIAEMKDPEKMRPELRRTFQSLIGFANIVGAMNGQPQLDLDMEKSGDTQFVTSSYLPDPKAKDSKVVKLNYNFSPSIAFAGERFVVASTNALAHSLATASVSERPARDADRVVNANAELRFDPLQNILKDNRGQLVAQNMLKEGHTKDEADRDVAILLELIGWFDHLGLAVDTAPSELRVTLDLAMKHSD